MITGKRTIPFSQNLELNLVGEISREEMMGDKIISLEERVKVLEKENK